MTEKKMALLPKEVTALVHHIELNKSGWWDKVVQRLVLSSIWLTSSPPNRADIQKTLEEAFCLSLNTSKLDRALRALLSEKILVRLPKETFKIVDFHLAAFTKEIEEGEEITRQAQDIFNTLAQEICENLDCTDLWNSFESKFLAPLIQEVGSNAFHLISGNHLNADMTLVDTFMAMFPSDHHDNLRALVVDFLDPKRGEVRDFISCMLHAQFCVESSGLSETVIKKLNKSIGKKTEFRVFVDTNFLFSLLDLHDNPSNDAAHELRALIKQLDSSINIQLYIIPTTITEAKNSISTAKRIVSDIPTGNNFTAAALDYGLMGMSSKFLEERFHRGGSLKAEDWFDPYLKNFAVIAGEKGVELCNDDLSTYATRQDVLADIKNVETYQKSRPNKKPKRHSAIRHDMILWHYVNDQRPAYIESPIEARNWILTVDFSLIGFDQHKKNSSQSTVPLCLHPTSLIQLLQFWVPRTKEFEEAMLGSMRLPFLFQKFDAEAEQITLKILEGLGRFEGRDDIKPETITQIVLNEGLRSRLVSEPTMDEQEEMALIKDALVKELQAKADTEVGRSQVLMESLKTTGETLAVLESKITEKDTELESLKELASIEKGRATQANENLGNMNSEITGLKGELDRGKRFLSFLGYVFLLFVVISCAGVAAWFGVLLTPGLIEFVGIIVARISIGVFFFLVGHLALELWANRRHHMAQLWPFRIVKRFRIWLWGAVVLVFIVGISVNLLTDQIINHKEKTSQQSSSSTSPVKSLPSKELKKKTP